MKTKIWILLLFLGLSRVLHADNIYADDTNIPEDALEFNGHTYKYYIESTDWYSAKEICNKYGGHLVTITSLEENTFLIDNLPNYNKAFYWIGATDEKQEGLWQWVTDETFSFCNWSEDSPDNNGNKEHYAGFMSEEKNYDGYPTPIGSWNDFQISSTDDSGYICEWDFIKETDSMKKNVAEESDTNDNYQQVKENVDSQQGNSNNSNEKPNNFPKSNNIEESSNSFKTPKTQEQQAEDMNMTVQNSQNDKSLIEETNKDITITFHIDNLSLSLIGGVTIFGGISISGFVIKKYKKRRRQKKDN